MSDRLVRAPVRLLVMAAVAAAVSVLAYVPGSRPANIVGYVSGSFLAISIVALFRREDAKRSSSPWYSPQPFLDYASVGLLVIGLASAIGHMWFLSQRLPS